MGRGIIGESGSDRAMNKMIKHLEKSDRQNEKNGPKPKNTDNLIVQQLKELYPDTWQEELDEMTLEHKNPQYLADKKVAKEEGRTAYYSQSRGERDRAGISEGQFIRRYINQWKRDNRYKYESK
jgi:hypothetical protein